MPWNNLGIVTLSDEFRLFNTYSNATTFRLTALNFASIPRHVRGFAWVKTQFMGLPASEGGETPWRRFWPNDQSTILELPRPRELELAGYYSRLISAKKGRGRYTASTATWLLQLEEFEPPVRVLTEATVPANVSGQEISLLGRVQVDRVKILVLEPFTNGYVGIFSQQGIAIYELSTGLGIGGNEISGTIGREFNNAAVFVSTYSATAGSVRVIFEGSGG